MGTMAKCERVTGNILGQMIKGEHVLPLLQAWSEGWSCLLTQVPALGLAAFAEQGHAIWALCAFATLVIPSR